MGAVRAVSAIHCEIVGSAQEGWRRRPGLGRAATAPPLAPAPLSPHNRRPNPAHRPPPAHPTSKNRLVEPPGASARAGARRTGRRAHARARDRLPGAPAPLPLRTYDQTLSLIQAPPPLCAAAPPPAHRRRPALRRRPRARPASRRRRSRLRRRRALCCRPERSLWGAAGPQTAWRPTARTPAARHGLPGRRARSAALRSTSERGEGRCLNRVGLPWRPRLGKRPRRARPGRHTPTLLPPPLSPGAPSAGRRTSGTTKRYGRRGEGRRARALTLARARAADPAPSLSLDAHPPLQQCYLGGFNLESEAAKAHDVMSIKTRGGGAVVGGGGGGGRGAPFFLRCAANTPPPPLPPSSTSPAPRTPPRTACWRACPRCERGGRRGRSGRRRLAPFTLPPSSSLAP